jgi:hypothetical protein
VLDGFYNQRGYGINSPSPAAVRGSRVRGQPHPGGTRGRAVWDGPSDNQPARRLPVPEVWPPVCPESGHGHQPGGRITGGRINGSLVFQLRLVGRLAFYSWVGSQHVHYWRLGLSAGRSPPRKAGGGF